MKKKKVFLFRTVFIAFSLMIITFSFSIINSMPVAELSEPLPKYTAAPKPSVPTVIENEKDVDLLLSENSVTKTAKQG